MRNISIIFSICLFIVTGCAQDSDYVVTIKTSYGDMIAILYDETPKHKENFIKLAQEHFFDSTLFHRVIQGFMIQGGDPDSKKAQPGLPLRSEEHTSELQSQSNLVCRLLLEKKK